MLLISISKQFPNNTNASIIFLGEFLPIGHQKKGDVNPTKDFLEKQWPKPTKFQGKTN
jgi:hypothetical protein